MANTTGLFTHQTTRRTFLSGTAAAAAMLALSACSPGGGGTGGAGGGGAVSLLANDSADWEKQLRDVIAAYQGKNSSTTVNLLNIADGEQYNTKVKTQALAKTLPDIYYVRTLELAAHAENGWLQPLDGFIKDTKNSVNRADFYPAVEAQFSAGGKLVALPEDMSGYGIYVNKTMFADLGIPVPNGDWTWDDFYEISEAFTLKEGGKQTRWGGFVNGSSWGMRGVMKANGGEVFSEDGSKAIVDNDANIATFEQINAAIKAGAVPSSEGLPTGVDPFAGGLVAMFMNGSWYAAGAKEAIADKFEWEIVALPKGSTGKREIATAGGGWGLSRDAKNVDAAWKFLDYLGSEPVQSTIPYLQSALVTARTTDPARDLLFPAIGEDAAAISYPPLWAKYEIAYGNRVASLMNGGDPRETLAAIQEETNR